MNHFHKVPPGLSFSRDRNWTKELLFGDRGVASIEFVIIVPLMLMMMLGFTEIYMYKRAVSMIEHTAFTLADSVGQMTTVVDTDAMTSANTLGSIWNAASMLAQPNVLQGRGGVTITSVCDENTTCVNPAQNAYAMTNGNPQKLWQRSAPWNLKGLNTRETTNSYLPSTWPFRAGDSAIVIEVFYTYNPFAMTSVFWESAPGTQTIYERVYVRPRGVPALALSASAT